MYIYLSLAKCQLNGRFVELLGDLLKKNASLQTLILSWNDITDTSFSSILEALKVNKTLQNLHMGKCDIYFK